MKEVKKIVAKKITAKKSKKTKAISAKSSKTSYKDNFAAMAKEFKKLDRLLK